MDCLPRSWMRALALPALVSLAACTSSGPPPLTDLNTLTVNKAQLLWEEDAGDAGVGFVPSINGNLVWVANQSGEVVSLDLATGETVSEFDTGRDLASGVAVDGSSLVVIDTDGVMLVQNTRGEPLWQADLGAEPLTVPVIQSGQVILRLSNSTVVSYDMATGKRRWLFAQRNPSLVLRQNAAIGTDLSSAFVGMDNGRVVALSLSTGASRWEARISVPRGSNEIERISDVIGMPVVTGRNVCAAAYQGRLTCVDTNNGKPIWSQDIKAGSGVALDSQRVVVADVDGRIHAFSRSQLELWKQDTLRGRRLATPALIDGQIWVGDAGGVVHVLDGLDGRVIGRVETDGSAIISSPIAARLDGKTAVIFQTSNGTVAALATE